MSSQIKNRGAASIQITAEQLLREAQERGLEDAERAPRQFITDMEELRLYQQTKRKDFEDQIRRQRQKMGLWIRYGVWEASQKEFERARSVFERALDIDYRNESVWMKYIEIEMKNKFINHARNLLDRCLEYLPRIDKFWYKYVYMEELVGAIDQARQVFERWMKWEPDDSSWHAFIAFEVRQGNPNRARSIYERYVTIHPTSRAFLKYGKWEERQRQFALARKVYERSLVEVHPSERSPSLLISFARFEERSKEVERARVLYKFAMETISKGSEMSKEFSSEELHELEKEYLAFEKRYGSREMIEAAILERRRQFYEGEIKDHPFDYDIWLDYIRLEENEGQDWATTRALYDRAVNQTPPVAEKRYWKRYIYLWINYALFEELIAQDIPKAREVYKRCLQLLPHRKFTFGKIWMLAAELEIRQKDLSAARKLLGQAIGMCPKENIFKGYIHIERQLGEIDRCRLLYAKYIEWMPYNSQVWKNFAALESSLGESSRARCIYEIAIQQPELDMPEAVWKSFIDFENNEGELDRARQLYELLLSKTQHMKVWIAYAQLEISQIEDRIAADDNQAQQKARSIFTRGVESMKNQGLQEERALLLEAFRDFEAGLQQNSDNIAKLEGKLPKKVKMHRKIVGDHGEDLGSEDYYEYQFPEDEKKIAGLKFLENAMKWKLAAGIPSSGSDAVVANKEELDIDDI